MTTNLQTTQQVADTLGVSPRTIRDRAKRYRVGTLLNSRTLVFSQSEIERLRPHIQGAGKRGRPKHAT